MIICTGMNIIAIYNSDQILKARLIFCGDKIKVAFSKNLNYVLCFENHFHTISYYYVHAKILQLSLKDSILLPIESFEVINFSVLQPQALEHI
jgi:hypothetical protein